MSVTTYTLVALLATFIAVMIARKFLRKLLPLPTGGKQLRRFVKPNICILIAAVAIMLASGGLKQVSPIFGALNVFAGILASACLIIGALLYLAMSITAKRTS